MVLQGLNGLRVDEGAEVDVVPAVRVAADESLFRKRGDFHRPVGGEPVHIGDLRVALEQDVQDRGIDKPVLLLCQKRQRPALFRGDRSFGFDGWSRVRLLDLCPQRGGLFDGGFGGQLPL
jgi:hypothetical protein